MSGTITLQTGIFVKSMVFGTEAVKANIVVVNRENENFL